MQKTKGYDLVLNALGDPTRRAIFEKLKKGPLCVAHIAEGLKVTRPAVSQHLRVLREARLISMTQEGTRSFYRIEAEGLQTLRAYLDRFWDKALDNFKVLAEATEKSNAKR